MKNKFNLPGVFIKENWMLWLFILCITNMSAAQTFTTDKLSILAEKQFAAVITELRETLSIPNDASYPVHVGLNVKWAEEAFLKRNFIIRKLTTEGPPILVASRKGDRPQKTVLFYLQIDGQPVDSSRWDQESPYKPVLKEFDGTTWQTISWDNMDNYDPEWRIFARSASDAKGPVAMFLGAIDIIDAQEFHPDFDIKVVMDFEEELGSPHLPDAVKNYKDELKADMLVILDGPRHISNKPTLTFGARGITTITLKVFGPKVPQHSGHYGNYVPNPALRLSRLLASMKDENGRVTIPGYYDGILLDNQIKAILQQVPDDETFIRKELGIADIDRVADNYQESIQYPSLNIRGLQSAWIGSQVRTIIPATATAEIDVRLVPETSSDRLLGLIRKHIEKQGFHFVEGTPTDEERMKYSRLISMQYENSYAAFRTPFDSDIGIWLTSAMFRAFGIEPIRKRMSGGSIPISPFVSTLNIPAVTVPTVNSDNNQHSPNENIRLGNIKEGILACLAILTEKMK